LAVAPRWLNALSRQLDDRNDVRCHKLRRSVKVVPKGEYAMADQKSQPRKAEPAAARHPERWATRLGVILAVAGSAVGLGNFLRFPGVAAENGGGAFMIPYFCALIFLGIPIGWAEWAMGRYGGTKGYHSTPGILGVLGGRTSRYLGVIGVLIPLVIYFYYIVIEGWCLAYCWDFIRGGIGIDLDQTVSQQVGTSREFFADTTGAKFNGVTMEGGLHESVIFWLIVSGLNLWFLHRGLSKGIESFCKWAMPLMAVCGLIVLVRVLTLGTPDPNIPENNVENGLGFMWNPDFSKLGNFNAWLAAAGQIFFSLSVGFGVIVNYASYVRRRDDVVLSGLTASATNEFFEVVLGGLITIPAAVVFLGIGLTHEVTATGSSFNLGFNTLPVVFAHMPLGNFFGAVWFFMLFLAAITSSLSMVQPAKAFFEEALGLSKSAATGLISVVTLLGSFFVIWYSKDLVALDTMDFWVGTFLLFVLATVQIILFGWVFGVDRGIAEAEQGSQMRIPPGFRFVMKYVAPAYLLIVFCGFLYQNFIQPYVRGEESERVAQVMGQVEVQYTLVIIAIVAAGLVAVTWLGERRWKRYGPGTMAAEVDYPVTHPRSHD
jgi:SNF family Na+-dependent transporter